MAPVDIINDRSGTGKIAFFSQTVDLIKLFFIFSFIHYSSPR